MTARFALIALICLAASVSAIDKAEFDIAERGAGKVVARGGGLRPTMPASTRISG